MPWYKDIEKAIKEDIISPARTIFEKNLVLSPEEQEMYRNAHKVPRTTKIGKTVNFLQEDYQMTKGETDKATKEALISEIEEETAMITIEQARVQIDNSIEKYNKNIPNIDEETDSVILDILSSKENSALLSVSHILQNYKSNEKKANKQITDAITSRYNQLVTNDFYQVTNLGYLFPLETILTMS